VAVWVQEELLFQTLPTEIRDKIAQAFTNHFICGRHLLRLNHEFLKEMGISEVGLRFEILDAIARLSLKGTTSYPDKEFIQNVTNQQHRRHKLFILTLFPSS